MGFIPGIEDLRDYRVLLAGHLRGAGAEEIRAGGDDGCARLDLAGHVESLPDDDPALRESFDRAAGHRALAGVSAAEFAVIVEPFSSGGAEDGPDWWCAICGCAGDAGEDCGHDCIGALGVEVHQAVSEEKEDDGWAGQ